MCDSPEPHVCFSCIEFTDGSVEAMPLCIDTLEVCRKTQEIIPAIAYSGDKTPKGSFIGITTHERWCEAWAEDMAGKALDEQKVGG